MEVQCKNCGLKFSRAPSEALRRKYQFCSAECSIKYESTPKKSILVKTDFDKRIVSMKSCGMTYKKIAEEIVREGLSSPSGRPISAGLIQSRFNYLIGRRLGPVKVWRGSVRQLKVPKFFTIQSNTEIQEIRREIDGLKRVLKKHRIL